METKHVVFNPTMDYFRYSALRSICEHQEEHGWELIRVVHNHQYESVAVFQRTSEHGSD